MGNSSMSVKQFWKGRKSTHHSKPQYWHQAINCISINEWKRTSRKSIGILGYACDEGVKRNQGRVGAIDGPNAIRSKMGSLAFHLENKELFDFGNVYCNDDDLENCQTEFASKVEKLLSNNIFPIGIGGGHDIAFAHFSGIWNSVKSTTNRKIGIINFDAHLDLRPLLGRANSGTPFNQVFSKMKTENETVKYFAIGIQKLSNPPELFEIANENNVDIAFLDECHFNENNLNSLKDRIVRFSEQVDYIYVTIDLDGFSSAYVQGVSAPSPFGFTPEFVIEVLRNIFETQKVISCDLAEMNPVYDQDQLTAKLASNLIGRMAEWV